MAEDVKEISLEEPEPLEESEPIEEPDTVTSGPEGEQVEIPKDQLVLLELEEIGKLAEDARKAEININPAAVREADAVGFSVVSPASILKTHSYGTNRPADETRRIGLTQGVDIDGYINRIGQGENYVEILQSMKASDSKQKFGTIGDQQQKEIAARRRAIEKRGKERLITGEAGGTLAERREQYEQLVKGDEKTHRLFDEESEGMAAERAIVQAGTPKYQKLKMRAEILSNPEVAAAAGADVERAKLTQDHLKEYDNTSSTSRMIRDTFAEDGFQAFVTKLTDYDTAKEAEKLGISSLDGEPYKKLQRRFYQKALYEVALYRTVNKYTPPAFMSWDKVDPTGRLSSSDKDDMWITKLKDKATQGRVELIGLDSKGVPVFRATSPTMHVFEMMDVLQSAATGSIERAFKGPKGESLWEAITEGSLEGVAERRDAMKAMLSTEAARSSTLAALGLGSIGLVVAVLSPDLLMGGAGVAKYTNKIAKAAKATAKFKAVAPELIDQLAKSAGDAASADVILKRVDEAILAGDDDAAIALMEEAKALYESSGQAAAVARAKSPDTMRVVDELDSEISKRVSKRVPQINLEEGRQLGLNIPGRFGHEFNHIHPSQLRVQLRPTDPDVILAPTEELFGTANHLTNAIESLDLIRRGKIDAGFQGPAYIEAVAPFRDKLQKNLDKLGLVRRSSDLSEDMQSQLDDLFDYIDDYDNLVTLRTNPVEWQSQIREKVQRVLTNPEVSDRVSKSVDRLDRFVTESGDKVAAKYRSVYTRNKNRVDADTARRSLAKGIQGIRANNESRAAAMAFIRKEVGEQAGIKTSPILRSVTDPYKEIGEGYGAGKQKLSPESLDFRDQIEDAIPGMSSDEATKLVAQIDSLARKWSEKTGNRVLDYYAGRFAGIERKLTDIEFRQLDDGLTLISSKETRDVAKGSGLTFKVEGGSVVIKDADLPRELRGQGIGTDLYLQAINLAKKEGLGFSSDVNPSPDAIRVYKRLQQRGAPLKASLRKEDGVDLLRYTMTADELAEAKIIDAGREISASNPVVLDFLDDGRVVIKALGDATNIEDFMKVVGKVARRDLDEKQMKALQSWLAGRGIKVGVKGAIFVDADPATIQKAEDAFAESFQDFIVTGQPDSVETASVWQSTKDWVSDMYSGVRRGEAEGVEVVFNKDLRQALDGIVDTELPKESAFPNLIELAKEAVFDSSIAKLETNVFEDIVRETQRRGYPISMKVLKKQFKDANDAILAGRPGDAVIELPGPVFYPGVISNVDGKTVLTLEDVSKIQLMLEQNARFATQAKPRLPLTASTDAVTELTPSEIIDQYMAKVTEKGTKSSVTKFVSAIYIGGDAYVDMRDLPPLVRDSVMSGVRRVQQSVGDIITLVSEGDMQNTLRYLTGDATVQFRLSGRQALSAGHDSVASVVSNLDKFFSSVNKEKMRDLIEYVELVRKERSATSAIRIIQGQKHGVQKLNQLNETIKDIVSGEKTSRFVKEVFESAGKSNKAMTAEMIAKSSWKDDDVAGLMESLLFLSGKTKRQGKYITGTSTQKFENFYKDLTNIFGSPVAGQRASNIVANRILVLTSAHGMAQAAKMQWMDLGIMVNADIAKAFNRFVVGEYVDPENMAEVKKIFQVMGFKPQFVEAADLFGMPAFVPKAARERLGQALSQAMDPAIADPFKRGKKGALEQLGSGEAALTGAGLSGTLNLSAAWVYRYMKTRMVRGHFVLKSRYFWMNTFDHFNQMAQRAGFAPALVSTSRMVTQNLLSNPLGQAVVYGARVTGQGTAGESVRRVLQDAGDTGAKWAGQLTRASKWNIKVNPILDGTDGFIELGGKVYSYNQLRQIALEAGIFSSFDTRELGIKIKKVGDMYLSQAERRGTLVERGAGLVTDLSKVSEDIAEAWSERERVGAMVTLMEMGVDPRSAAKVSVEALYDYAGSMSKADRYWLVNIFFPFWAFQKNANRQLLDTVFSPAGAYRLGVMRRGYEKGTDLISHLVYDMMVDEFGIDVDALNPELKESYDGFKAILVQEYGSLSKIPPDVRQDIRIYLAGGNFAFTDGSLFQGSIRQKRLHEMAQEAGISPVEMGRYFVERPDKAGRATYMRERPGIDIPYTRDEWTEPTLPGKPPKIWTKNINDWLDLYQLQHPDSPYNTLFLPEPVYMASFDHMANTTASLILFMKAMKDSGPSLLLDVDDGSEAVSFMDPLLEVLQPSRAPFFGELMGAMNMNSAAHPKKIHPILAKFIEEDLGIEVLGIDEKKDPYLFSLQRREAIEAGEEPMAEDVPTATTKINHYMMPGPWQLLFANSPFGELNDIMLKGSQTPLEEASGTQGEIYRWARIFTGLDQKETFRSRTAKSEMFKAQQDIGSKAVEKKLKGK